MILKILSSILQETRIRRAPTCSRSRDMAGLLKRKPAVTLMKALRAERIGNPIHVAHPRPAGHPSGDVARRCRGRFANRRRGVRAECRAGPASEFDTLVEAFAIHRSRVRARSDALTNSPLLAAARESDRPLKRRVNPHRDLYGSTRCPAARYTNLVSTSPCTGVGRSFGGGVCRAYADVQRGLFR